MAVDIVKPTSDKLSYRFVELHNGIKVVLVSDPETDKSAAALDVRVGSFSDPENISGLAHFTEHMLFYNSEKYPIEDEYNKFVSERGGSTNAFTAAEDTNYHFNVNWEHLADALDRFAQFFICPLISADGVDREIHAVDSEHRKNLNSDAWRGMQLWKHLANPNHPFHKFSTGSLETLQEEPRKQGINVHDAMKRFYEEHYSANLMRLVVYGREDLDSLEELVRSKFSGVKDARRSALDVEPDMFSDSGFLVRVVPERESSILELSWDVPPQCKSYRSLPCNYLSHLLGHEGHGSCFHLLKERKWVSSLLAGEGSLSISSRSIFTVRVELTDEGFDHVLDIATVVFQYINLLRRPEGVAQSIFDEMKALAEMNFNLSDKQNPSTIATGLASALQIFPPEHALLGMYNVPLEFDAAAIRGVLDCLTPQRVRIMWSSKRHAGTVTQSEPIYGTQFQKEPIPQGYLELWEAAKPGEELFLPEPNPFIPSNFDIVEADPLEAPEVIASDDMYKLWYMPDKVFKTPKVYMYTQLVSPVAYGTPEQAVSTRLWVKLLNDYLSALTYPAELAGLYYSLSNSPSGVQLVVHGYNDRLRVLLQKVLQHIEGFEVKRDRFAVCKEQLAREYANMCYDQPYQRAMYNTAMICEARRWHVDEYKAAIAGIEAEDLDRHGTALVAKLFAEVFVMGNITREDAAAHAEDVTAAMRRMGSRPVPACQMPDTRIVELPKGIPLLSSKMGPNPENENSVALITFQGEAGDMRSSCCAQLLAHVGKASAFHQLRTIEQLGYIVFMIHQMDSTVANVRFILQSSSHTAGYMQSRVMAFLPSLEEALSNMDEKAFREQVEELVKAKLEKPKRLSSEAGRMWKEITAGTRVFDRPQREAEVLRGLQIADLRSFFKSHIKSSTDRRLLSVHVRGKNDPGEPEGGDPAAGAMPGASWGRPVVLRAEGGGSPEAMLRITDEAAFKRSQALYPSAK